MDNKRRLLTLLKMMKVPLSDREVEELVNKLKSESVDKLTLVYEELKKFEDNLEYVAKNTDPETYQKLKDEYYQTLLVLQEEFIKNTEEVQKNVDEQLDAGEIESENKINESYSSCIKNIDEIQNQHDSLHQYVNKKLS